ncbi:MAG: sugar phosphate isomerase/epimerase [Anaerolineales bacterium]|nr:sugar phosphate isomerase/epimerase [Anaerolineales bacterium]
MPAPMALQLYSVRGEMARDFDGTVERVAAMGYAGVETGGFAPGSATAAAQLFKSLGLSVCGYHTGLPLGEKLPELLDTLAALDCRRLVIAYAPPESFQSLDGVKQTAERLNEAAALAQAGGLSLGYHNHWFEFYPLAGRPAYDYLVEALAPEVFLEVDVYWAQTGGVDPAGLVRRLGTRAPLLHLKDGPAQTGLPMTALGDGAVDIAACVAAGAGTAEWLVVELDECATDMPTAVERSFQYLSERGLGRGQAG